MKDFIDDSKMFELLQESFLRTSKNSGEIIVDYAKLLDECYKIAFNNELIINIYRLYIKNGNLTNRQIAALIRFRGDGRY